MSAQDAQIISFPTSRARPSGSRFNLPHRRGDKQLVLDFAGSHPPCRIERLRPADATRRAYALYVRASQLDEDPATYDAAITLYKEAIDLDPSLTHAEVNLGNVLFRRGKQREAEALYAHAIKLQHFNPEAHYNLGFIMLERGRPEDAIARFEIAVSQDSRFADAFFNLAMALEQVSERRKARAAWRRYLDLEPDGDWAGIAREHL